MAIFDAMFEFADNQDMFDSAATYYVTTGKTLDWNNTDLEMGAGEPVWLNVRVGTVGFAGGTSVQAILVGDTAAGGHDGSSTTLLSGPVVAVGATTTTAPGAWLLRCPLPYNIDDLQYTGVAIVNDGANTAGKVDAWLDHGPQSSFDTQVTTSNIT